MKHVYTRHKDYSVNMAYFYEEKFKYTINSKKYPLVYAFITTKSSAVAGHDGEPGTGGEFFVFEGKEGYNRIESVKWPNHFVYESSGGYANIRNDGANMKDDALFLMTSLGDNTMTISSKKWPENRMCYNMSGRNPGVVFSKKKDDSSLWILDSKEVSSKLPASASPKSLNTLNKSIKLNPHRHDEKISFLYEPARGKIDDAAILGVQSHAQCVIAKCAFNHFRLSKKKSEMFTNSYKGKEVRLDHQGDVENSDFGKSRWFANLHVQTQKRTVAQALIEIGPIFGIRYIRRMLTESLESQYRTRLMADQITPSNRK